MPQAPPPRLPASRGGVPGSLDPGTAGAAGAERTAAEVPRAERSLPPRPSPRPRGGGGSGGLDDSESR